MPICHMHLKCHTTGVCTRLAEGHNSSWNIWLTSLLYYTSVCTCIVHSLITKVQMLQDMSHLDAEDRGNISLKEVPLHYPCFVFQCYQPLKSPLPPLPFPPPPSSLSTAFSSAPLSLSLEDSIFSHLSSWSPPPSATPSISDLCFVFKSFVYDCMRPTNDSQPGWERYT